MAVSKSTTQNLFGEIVSIPPLERRRRFAIGEANCKECGKIFTVYESGKSRRGRTQFCSHRCQAIFVSKKNAKKNIGTGKPKELKVYQCRKCGGPRLSRRRYCDDCKEEIRKSLIRPKITKPCVGCGASITGRASLRYCEECNKKRQKEQAKAARKKYRQKSLTGERRARRYKERAKQFNVSYEYINVGKVFERDRWRCQICGIKTPKKLRGAQQDNAPELEHRIPMALGGSHTYDNVQCSCRKCNCDKGSTHIRGQMHLFPKGR